MDHTIIHAPQYQGGMHRAHARPACWTDQDTGHVCACCYDPDQHQIHLRHTPGCELCVAGQIAAAIYYQYAVRK